MGDCRCAGGDAKTRRAVTLGSPGAEYLAALDELISLGYLRGILNKLAEIERLDTKHSEFVRVLRDLARQFQFDAMKELLRKMTDAAC